MTALPVSDSLMGEGYILFHYCDKKKLFTCAIRLDLASGVPSCISSSRFLLHPRVSCEEEEEEEHSPPSPGWMMEWGMARM